MRRNSRWWAPAVALVALAVVVVGATAAAAQKPTVKVASTASYGKLVASSGGFTLYHYTDETRGKIDCKGGCAKLWPPLLVKSGGKATAGPGLAASKLGTIRRPDGGLQVTYNGWALYRYAPDTKAGDVKGQGVEHAWFAISPAGKLVKRMASVTPPASTPPPTETTPAGGGYDYG